MREATQLEIWCSIAQLGPSSTGLEAGPHIYYSISYYLLRPS